MSTPTDAERGLILRHLAALLRHGLPMGEALPLLAAHVPAGAAREQLERAQAALQRGEATPVDEPLLALLSRSEAAGGEAFEEATRSFDLLAQAQQTARRGFAALLIALVVIGLADFSGTRAMEAMERFAEVQGPTLVRLSSLLARLLLYGTVLVIVLMLAFRTRVFRLLPGVRGFEKAARLRLYSAGLAAGVGEGVVLSWIDPSRPASLAEVTSFQLDAYEILLLKQALATGGVRSVVQAMAAEIESSARNAVQRFATYGPPFAFGVLVVLVVALLIGFFSPIFNMAGAIR